MNDCHICGRMVVPFDQTVRFPSCECHIEMARLKSERDAALAEVEKWKALLRKLFYIRLPTGMRLDELLIEWEADDLWREVHLELNMPKDKTAPTLGLCMYCQKPRVEATSASTGCCDGERGRAGYCAPIEPCITSHGGSGSSGPVHVGELHCDGLGKINKEIYIGTDIRTESPHIARLRLCERWSMGCPKCGKQEGGRKDTFTAGNNVRVSFTCSGCGLNETHE